MFWQVKLEDNTDHVISGYASICPNEKHLLVDNLSTGYDMYNFPRTSPARSFKVPTSRKFIKQGVFVESATGVACGSDHGYVYVFRAQTSKPAQMLQHAGKKVLIQAIDVSERLLTMFITLNWIWIGHYNFRTASDSEWIV